MAGPEDPRGLHAAHPPDAQDPSTGVSTDEAGVEMDVRQVARLARLAITDDEADRFAGQLDAILHYVAKIRSVDVADTPPTAHALRLWNVLRDDVSGPTLGVEDVLRNAPHIDPPFFAVPKVIGGDEDGVG